MTTQDVPEWIQRVLAPNPGPMTLEGTNTWVLGEASAESLVVVDPGPLDERHLGAIAERGEIAIILLTHGHPDHSKGAERLRRITGAPVLAFDPAHVQQGEALVDGGRFEHHALTISTLHTPGHTPDSVSFLVERQRDAVLLTGDTILGRGTTMIDHPEGRLDDYFTTLERLRAVGDVLVLPGHGPAGGTAIGKATDYLAHRRHRLMRVQDALEGGAVTARDVVEVVYADVPKELWAAAERSVTAQLVYLRSDQRLGRDLP